MESIDLHMVVITTICSRNEFSLSDCCIRTLRSLEHCFRMNVTIAEGLMFTIFCKTINLGKGVLFSVVLIFLCVY